MILSAFVLALVLCMAGPQVCGLSAEHALVMDACSGEICFEKDADEPCLIASTTKIMTGLLVAEDCDLDERIAIPPEAVGIEGSSLYLRAGEVLTVRDLLYGLMLHSGNDAAVALAIAHSGSVTQFVAAMNARARELGLERTEYANPHGLDAAQNVSTARDLARLAAYAMENAVFRSVVSSRTYQCGQRSLTNHNRLLWQYEGAEGVKTGYTRAAGRVLVSSAVRGGRRLIAVTITAPDDWNDHRQLLDEAFSAYTSVTLCRRGDPLGVVLSGRADSSCCAVYAAQDVTILCRPQQCGSLRIRLTADRAEFYLEGHPVGSCGLTTEPVT